MDKFIRELTQQVLDKTGEPKPEIAFFAPSEIKTGEEWAQVLGDALRTSKAIVCLCTPHYFSSQYCGKELGVFLLRRELFRTRPGNAQRKAAVIFPIVWEWPVGGLHKTLKKFQNRQTGFPKAYVDNGLNAILRLRREADFQAIVINLAAQIRDAIQESRLPDWPTLPEFDAIESVFHTQDSAARYQYGLAIMHDEGADWKPIAGGPSVYQLCEIVAAQTSRLCRPVVANADIVERLREAASKREAFVLITDLRSAEGPYRQVLLELNDASLKNCAVFVLSGDAVPEHRSQDLERLRTSFGKLFAQSLPHNWMGIRSAETLTGALIDALVKIGTELMRADPALKVTDENLVRAAIENGIRTENVPVLGGPGRQG